MPGQIARQSRNGSPKLGDKGVIRQNTGLISEIIICAHPTGYRGIAENGTRSRGYPLAQISQPSNFYPKSSEKP